MGLPDDVIIVSPSHGAGAAACGPRHLGIVCLRTIRLYDGGSTAMRDRQELDEFQGDIMLKRRAHRCRRIYPRVIRRLNSQGPGGTAQLPRLQSRR